MNKEKNEEIEADVIIVTETIKIDDGKHTGIISNVTRDPPSDIRRYDYTDIEITVTDHKKKPQLKAGFPSTISDTSSLGRLLINAGMDFSVDEHIKINDVKELLVDKEVTFLSKNEKTDKGEFSKIIRDTIEFV